MIVNLLLNNAFAHHLDWFSCGEYHLFIYIGQNDLTGGIPSQLAQATGLKELNIGDNKIKGTIPTEIGSIATLQQLDIGGNDINGTIPTEIESLSNLTVLSIGTCHET